LDHFIRFLYTGSALVTCLRTVVKHFWCEADFALSGDEGFGWRLIANCRCLVNRFNWLCTS
jgi:hypothetical protein